MGGETRPPLLSPREAGEPELTDLALGWAQAFGDRLQAGAGLVMAETRLALTTFLLMIFLVILAAGAALLGWALGVVAIAQAAIDGGVPPLAATLGLMLVHVALAWGLWRWANALSRHMEFRATREMLLDPTGKADAERGQ